MAINGLGAGNAGDDDDDDDQGNGDDDDLDDDAELGNINTMVTNPVMQWEFPT